ncbi:MAG: hypothetical protein WD075_05275 [Rhodospirillales bacterium]
MTANLRLIEPGTNDKHSGFVGDVLHQNAQVQLNLPFMDECNFGVVWNANIADITPSLLSKGVSEFCLTAIVDIRRSPKFGDTPQLHHLFCEHLEKLSIKYFRIGHLIARAEKAASFNFQKKDAFINCLIEEEWMLLDISKALREGSVLFIHGDGCFPASSRSFIDHFLEATKVSHTQVFTPNGLWQK